VSALKDVTKHLSLMVTTSLWSVHIVAFRWIRHKIVLSTSVIYLMLTLNYAGSS